MDILLVNVVGFIATLEKVVEIGARLLTYMRLSQDLVKKDI